MLHTRSSPIPFSLVMALIIGIIGSLICVYSLGYMRHFYEHHPEIPDRTSTFFLIIFVFISAMFGLVFSNSLVWVYFFWEVTTLCSFLLIGFTKTDEATRNSFTALWMNVLGGIAFIIALIWLAAVPGGMLSLDQVLAGGKALILIPAAAHRVCGSHESRPDAVLLVARGRNGSPDPGLRPPPFELRW